MMAANMCSAQGHKGNWEMTRLISARLMQEIGKIRQLIGHRRSEIIKHNILGSFSVILYTYSVVYL